MCRLDDLKRFYSLMDKLQKKTGRKRKLEHCNSAKDQTDGGVYFFFENGERRKGSGAGDRVVRVGKCTSYRRRISRMHKGPPELLTGSNFRKWIANALFLRDQANAYGDWPDIAEANLGDMVHILAPEQQHQLEFAVRAHMYPMRLLFVPIREEGYRRFIEKNAIGLLSEYRPGKPIDRSSDHWLGHHCRSDKIRHSGLWNHQLVANGYDPEFLDELEECVNGVD